MDPYDPPLDKPRHLRYWKRCVRTLLPHHYTSMDSTRLSLAFFIIASIDLLTPPPSSSPNDSAQPEPEPLLTPADRLRLRRWVLSCQHPAGGFCASPTHVLPRHHQRSDVENAHLGGTYFALLLLALLSSDDDDDSADSAFAGVDRAATLRWLRRLQRPEDGSFGEIVYDPPAVPLPPSAAGEEGATTTTTTTTPPPMIAGGRDMRYSYLAAAVRWMLRDGDGDDEDIDVPALVAHIRRGQTYDGGFAESRAHESHAGYGYCAVAALALLDRPPVSGDDKSVGGRALREGVPDTPALARWLSSRQFVYIQNDNEDDDDDPETDNFHVADLSLADDHAPPAKHIGFNGRCNKIADTCYTWWTLGALAVLGIPPPSPSSPADPSDADLANLRARRAFLLDKTQHLIGGFGKNVGSPPDVGHACLGLAALATMGDPGLRTLDPALCVSVDAVRRVERARRGLLRREGRVEAGRGRVKKEAESGAAGVAADLDGKLVSIAVKMGGGDRPEWLDALA